MNQPSPQRHPAAARLLHRIRTRGWVVEREMIVPFRPEIVAAQLWTPELSDWEIDSPRGDPSLDRHYRVRGDRHGGVIEGPLYHGTVLCSTRCDLAPSPGLPGAALRLETELEASYAGTLLLAPVLVLDIAPLLLDALHGRPLSVHWLMALPYLLGYAVMRGFALLHASQVAEDCLERIYATPARPLADPIRHAATPPIPLQATPVARRLLWGLAMGLLALAGFLLSLAANAVGTSP